MKLPSEVRVLGQPFSVETVAHDDALFRGAGHDAIGSTDLNLQQIKIRGSGDISAHQALDTLLHETLHAVFYLSGAKRMLADGDEDMIATLAPVLLHTLRDNPALAAALVQDLSDGPDAD